MGEEYQEAIKLASQIVSEAFIKDMEVTLKHGTLLDREVQEAVHEIGRIALGQIFEEVDAYLIEKYKEPGWKIQAHPRVRFTTILGKVEVSSAYLWNSKQKLGIRPMKEIMGVEGNSYSEAVQRALVDFGSEKSFQRASLQFREHYGWEVGRGTILNHTERVAREADEYVIERLKKGSDNYPNKASNVEVDTIVSELDGCEIRTGIFMTAHQAGRSEHESNKLIRKEEWKEVRTGFVRFLGEVDKLYICRMGSYPELCNHLFEAACARGLTPETLVIAPGDGGNGLKEEMEIHFSKFQYILDHRHLESHFYETSEALGIEKVLQKSWVKKHMDNLWDNKVRTVLKDLEDLYKETENDRLRRLINHLNRFVDSVDYGRFKENGWPVGSGEVESAHRYVPQERLKIAGACWHPYTVNPMLSLRVIKANFWWDDFWKWLHDKRQKNKIRSISKGC